MESLTFKPTNKARLLLGLLSFLIILFLLLAFFVATHPPSAIDLAVSSAIQRNHTPLMDQVMTLISWFGHTSVAIAMVLITSALFYIFKYRRESLLILLAFASGLINSVIKIIVNRPRPTKELVRIVEIAKHESFPSGHTVFYTVFFGFLLMMMVHLKTIVSPIRFTVIAVCAFMISSIPFSRIYLGAHWFTDVTGGLILGMIYLILLRLLYLRSYLSEEK